MSNGYASSNLTSGFIDLATYDEQEKYTYGGSESIAYFVREVRKSTWFTQVPVVLSKSSGQPGFGQQWSAQISRAGDYLLQTWLRVQLPAVTSSFTNSSAGLTTATGATTTNINVLRWTRNLMHNLIRECSITFNDLVAARFDNFHLDFWAAFTVPAGKRNGYNVMIGNIPALTNPVSTNPSLLANGVQSLPAAVLNLPLPFFFSRDSGIALPTAALPYNEMRINFSFRNWTELLIKDTYTSAALPSPVPTTVYTNSIDGVILTNTTGGIWTSTAATTSDIAGGVMTDIGNNTQVWANYAIVSNEERKKMACAPRDILIEQVQTAPPQTIAAPAAGQTAYPSFDIRFSHAVKVLFWSAQNQATPALSNYTTDPQYPLGPWQSGNVAVIPKQNSMFGMIDFAAGSDPIDNTSLIYENTQRLQNMGSDYFSLVNPWYSAPVIPMETGYHSYSYSLDFFNIDPQGSTNYGKLTNVSIRPQTSVAASGAKVLATPNNTPGASVTATTGNYNFVTTCVNNNIIRISGGALGFPVL